METEFNQADSPFKTKWIERFTALAVGSVATGAAAIFAAVIIRVFRWISGL